MSISTNIIDTPLMKSDEDKLGLTKYIKALSAYLERATMPTTIAIQGQWGSGKTSLMNQLKNSLCEFEGHKNPNAPYFGIWINMWEYSIMRTPEETLMGVIKGMVDECTSLVEGQNNSASSTNQLISKTMSFLKKTGYIAAKTAAKTLTNVSGGLVDGNEFYAAVEDTLSPSDNVKETRPNDLKNAFAKVIDESISLEKSKGSNRRGFIFFVDDLDRINPEEAVKILELLKNIFEVNSCIFVLAIDYDVVVKGLKVKFGNAPGQGIDDRAYRSFFDKIIQMPFSMPVSAYDITTFLTDSILSIGFMKEEDLNTNLKKYIYTPDDEENQNIVTIDALSEMTDYSTGANPRSIKRLMNTLSLISIMRNIELEDEEDSLTLSDYTASYGLICLQISYPDIYEYLVQEPGFTSWDEMTARQFHLNEISEEKKELLVNLGEFDEEWEQVLYRMCQKNTYLANNALKISRLLNLIRSLIEPQSLENRIEYLLGMSSITSVASSDESNATVQNNIKKWNHTRTNDIDDYLNLISKEVPADVLANVKKFAEYIISKFSGISRVMVSKSEIAFWVTNRRAKRIRKFCSVRANLWKKDDKGRRQWRCNIYFMSTSGWTGDLSLYSGDDRPRVYVNDDDFVEELGYTGPTGPDATVDDLDKLFRISFEDVSLDSWPEDVKLSEMLI
ncbi:KAP family P-loop domain-containing protein [Ruminobacter amylophilus]|uniref:KAP family P-loop domain-containing protein n=1 Tax=Ruminobacter amylophilus TaxID=867 RepID=A0A662ZK55_9GAMM|nr:P-loop NTPase fold protein [Ruminobacter amylophilus]SFP76182.1 KAP family P-loop domain-containing protein [Ruminobacter amylophilus]